MRGAFIQSTLQLMPLIHPFTYTSMAIGCHARYQSAHWEQFGVGCLAQRHLAIFWLTDDCKWPSWAHVANEPLSVIFHHSYRAKNIFHIFPQITLQFYKTERKWHAGTGTSTGEKVCMYIALLLSIFSHSEWLMCGIVCQDM